MPPRRRGLSEADRALWAGYAARVTPLPGRTPLEAPPPAVTIVPPVAAPAPIVASRPRAVPPIAIGLPPPGLETKRWTALRRGKLRPERTLDLHGKRAQEAHGAVRAFLADALADGLRCVCVITGRGGDAPGGVLRREFPHWLNAPDLRSMVLGAAHPNRSNAGAVHLLLRRARP